MRSIVSNFKDPFQGLKTTDAILPEDSTEIVQIYNVNPLKKMAKIPIWRWKILLKTKSFSFELAILNKVRKTYNTKTFLYKSEGIIIVVF